MHGETPTLGSATQKHENRAKQAMQANALVILRQHVVYYEPIRPTYAGLEDPSQHGMARRHIKSPLPVCEGPPGVEALRVAQLGLQDQAHDKSKGVSNATLLARPTKRL